MTEYPNDAGVYKLTCIETGKIYVGKSINLKKRLDSHRYSENRPKGRCYFENVIIKYGWDSFKVEILEILENFDKLKDNKNLLERESYYIQFFESADKDIGYNTCGYSQDRTGLTHSEETKEKMRKSKVGRSLSESHKTNIKNKMSTEKNREKMRCYQTGRKLSEETKEKIKLSRLGKKMSEESKEKLRTPKSEEVKENLRKINTGKKHTEESKEKIRQANLGRKHSKETKEKMRNSKLKVNDENK